jgi:hypothetical protein
MAPRRGVPTVLFVVRRYVHDTILAGANQEDADQS